MKKYATLLWREKRIVIPGASRATHHNLKSDEF